ncbi:hypothetical protein I4U23_022370 [Adineta vaga]|nr:hypothetical protein I4U23_022370 [Adineta vaga]
MHAKIVAYAVRQTNANVDPDGMVTRVTHVNYILNIACFAPNKCQCATGWSGPTSVCSSTCQNGGKCIAPNKCQCASGWSGSNCQTNNASVHVVPTQSSLEEEETDTTTTLPTSCTCGCDDHPPTYGCSAKKNLCTTSFGLYGLTTTGQPNVASPGGCSCPSDSARAGYTVRNDARGHKYYVDPAYHFYFATCVDFAIGSKNVYQADYNTALNCCNFCCGISGNG